MLDHEKRRIVLKAFHKSSGFTLVEMLIVIAIIGIATALGLPSYRAWIHNTQARNAAESIQGGLQKARAEAVKSNKNVEFVLGTSPFWKIQLPGNIKPCTEIGTTMLECSTTEGAKNVTSTASPAGATTITFNNFGTVGVPPNQPKNTDGSDPFTQVELASSMLDAADQKKLRVMIGVAGNVRMCDPDLPLTDPRSC